MQVKQLVNFLNQKFPFKNQEDWDNVKVNTKSFFEHKLKKVLIGLDLNFSIIELAISSESNVIITHHPIYINPEDIKLEYIKKIRKLLSKNKITHIPLHTNYDISDDSMSFKLCEIISNSKPERGFVKSYGWIGSFEGTLNQLIEIIKEKWQIDYILSSTVNDKIIKNFYFGSGACGSEVETLLHNKSEIDVYITGEIKWNIWNLGSDMNKTLIDVGHNIESFFINDISKIIQQKKIPFLINSHHLKIKSF